MEKMLQLPNEVESRQQHLLVYIAEHERAAQAIIPCPDVPPPEPLTPIHLLPKLSDLDDVKVYLQSFEVLAAKGAWNTKQWVQLPAPLWETQWAYYSLQPQLQLDYAVFKRETSARLG